MELGSIVWARLDKFAYWPAMIYRNPINENAKKVCVKFFADNGRTANVSEHLIIVYKGFESFREYGYEWRRKAMAKLKLKKAKSTTSSKQVTKDYNSQFVTKNAFWTKAIAEADTVSLLPLDMRRQFYDQVLVEVIKKRMRTVHKTATSMEETHCSTHLLLNDIMNCAFDAFQWRLEAMVDCDALRAAIEKLDEDIPIVESSFNIRKYPSNRLFIDVTEKGPICPQCQCEKQNENESCCLNCQSDSNNNNNDNVCSICEKGENVLRCSLKNCGKYYHKEKCLGSWPQYHALVSEFQCPSHVCHTCESFSDFVSSKNRVPDDNLIKCIKCPASYHRITACIPAGAKILSHSSMICSRHHNDTTHVNTNWCFICGGEDLLVHCATCPRSTHKICREQIGIHTSDEDLSSYRCKVCVNGVLPLYGDVVWAKINSFPWKPAVIVPPWKIPKCVVGHRAPNKICVYFFDRKVSYRWLPSNCVYRMHSEGGQMQINDWENAAYQEAQRLVRKIKSTKPVYTDPRTLIVEQPYRYISANVWVAQAQIKLNSNINELSDEASFTRLNYRKVRVELIKNHEYGLLADEDIAENVFIMEFVGEVIGDGQWIIRQEVWQKKKEKMKKKEEIIQNVRFFRLKNGLYIDATTMGNESRFIIDSAESNCQFQETIINGQLRVGIHATRMIPKDSKIIFNHSGKKPAKTIGAEKRASLRGKRRLSDTQAETSGSKTKKRRTV